MKPSLPARIAGAAAALWLALQPAFADGVLSRRYTFDKLDAFWRNTLEQPRPSAAWFDLVGGATAPAPVLDVPGGFVPDVPFGGVIVGEDQTNGGGATARRGFPVIAMPQDVAPVLYRRLALLELYLGRYRYFERGSTDTAERLDLLRRRQISAGTELYLTGLMLYYAEPTLQAKCERLNRLMAVETEMLGDVAAVKLEPGWQPLLPVLTVARSRLDADQLRKLVCAVEPVRSRGEMRRIVTARVGAEVMKQVEAKVRDALVLLNKAAEEFQALVNDMDVEIKSAEIMELERVLGNVESNLLLVKNDQLHAADTIAEIQAVDLTQLSAPTGKDADKKVEDDLALMVGEIDKVLEATAGLSAVSDDPAIRQELKVCEALGSVYDGLDLTRDTASLEAAVLTPYAACLTAAGNVVRGFQAPSLDKAFAAELSRNVRQISDAFLTGDN